MTEKKAGATRARTREEADKGVEKCIELMTGGQWVTGRSHRAVAEEFGVSPATVKDWATSASRVIRLAIEGDREEIRARMVATLETIIADSLNKHVVDPDGVVMPSPEGRTAVAAVETQAKLLGLVEQKHRVEVNVQQYAKLTDEQMLEHVEAQLERLTELRTKLLAKKATPALPAHTENDDE